MNMMNNYKIKKYFNTQYLYTLTIPILIFLIILTLLDALRRQDEKWGCGGVLFTIVIIAIIIFVIGVVCAGMSSE